MKSILLKSFILFAIGAIVLLPIAWKFDSGYLDPFYTRFTTDKAPSLILGTSRAAQGLLPQEFQKIDPQMQNFAFTVLHSPFGKSYLSLVKKKIKKESSEGIFIVAVDPWAVAHLSSKERDENITTFRENSQFPAEINFVNINPNFEYILRYYDQPLYNVFEEKDQYMKLHKNGWLEVNILIDSALVQQHIKDKIKDYQKYAREGSISIERLLALNETVSYLKEHGLVYIIRLPVSPEMANLEKIFYPEFDSKMQSIANEYDVPYLNYIHKSGHYQTTDGNHLHKEAGQKLSQQIADTISIITRYK